MRVTLFFFAAAGLAMTLTGCPVSNAGVPDAGTDGGEADPVEPEPVTEPVSAAVGSAGATVAFGNSAIVVPAGALAEEVTITVTPIEPDLPAGFSAYAQVFEFGPPGLTFETPAQIRLPFSGDPALATIFWTTREDGRWTPLPTRFVDGYAVAEIEHFSAGFVGTACVGEGCCGRADGELDVLFVVDNSNSMLEEQALLAAELPRMARALATGDSDLDGEQDFPAIESLHVGVITTDMGTGGHAVATCEEPDHGDDGILRVAGGADLAGCDPPYAPVHAIESDASPDEVGAFAEGLACVARQGTGGCGFEQHLEATLKALVPGDSGITFYDGTHGHGDGENAGLLRDDSVVAIVLLTDEDDASASDSELYNPASHLYPEALNVRAHYHPEALHGVERYTAGLLGLRDDPSKLIFAAIAGVPTDLVSEDAADFDAILEDPRMQETLDPTMPGRLQPSCDVPDLGLAFPPRRIVQTARAFGANGLVHSLCTPDFAPAIDHVLRRASRRLSGACE